MRFNPPPNWPSTPRGWTPPPGWEPDPEWGLPPVGWPLWLENRSWFAEHKLLTGVGSAGMAVALLLCAIGSVVDDPVPPHQARASPSRPAALARTLAASPAIGQATGTASMPASDKATADDAATDRAAAEKAASAKAVAETARAKKAAAEKAAAQRAANRMVRMPNLVGLKLTIALDVASNAGLTGVTVCRTPDGDIPLWWSNWRVLGQDITAGERIRASRTVCLDAMKDSDM